MALDDTSNIKGTMKPTRQLNPVLEKFVKKLVNGSSSQRGATSKNASTAKEVDQSHLPNISNEEFVLRKKQFGSCKFYLDVVDIKTKQRIERGIKLLDAVCPHVCIILLDYSHYFFRIKKTFSQINVLMSSLTSLFPHMTTYYKTQMSTGK
jgi:hypothetical protein